MSRLKRLVPANILGACAAPAQRPGETEPDPDERGSGPEVRRYRLSIDSIE